MSTFWNILESPLRRRSMQHAGPSLVLSALLLSLIPMAGGTCGTTGTTGGTGSNNGSNGSDNSSGGTQGTGTTNPTGPALQADDHVMGNINAKVTVIEYGDLQCPCCGQFARVYFPTIKANYIDTGNVRYVFRHFPLTTIHPRAQPAAEAAECAATQVDFFAYEELTYATVDGNGLTILTDAQLKQNATGLGADGTTFSQCTAAHSKASVVAADVSSGKSLGVGGTPTFFVDEEQYPPKGSSICADAVGISAVIDKHLTR